MGCAFVTNGILLFFMGRYWLKNPDINPDNTIASLGADPYFCLYNNDDVDTRIVNEQGLSQILP